MIEILDFFADWCHPCQTMKPVLKELEEELKDKATFKILDADKNQELVQKYSVLSIPTYIVLKNGGEIARMVGVTPKQKFLDIVQQNLA